MKIAYLDNNATTPLDPRVFEAMTPYMITHFGNAASSSHSYGWEANLAVNESRKKVGAILGVPDARQVLWTSGATESNNIALQGAAQLFLDKGEIPHIITTSIEHKAVTCVCNQLEKKGCEVTYLPVNQHGQIEMSELKKALKPNTKIISIMAANNEIGSINPLMEIGAWAKENKLIFHCDAAQAVGKIKLCVQEMNIDLLSISGHKLYGPKGIGALYVAKSTPLSPIFFGSAEEKGCRPGTLNVPGIVGLATACELADQEMKECAQKLSKWRDRIIAEVTAKVPIALLNGHPTERLPNNVNFSFDGLSSDLFSLGLKKIACSSTSACSSSESAGSYVLKAIGRTDQQSRAALRLGLGKFNTEKDVDLAIQEIVDLYQNHLKRNAAL